MWSSTARSWRMFLPLAAVLLLSLLWTVYWVLASGVAQSRLAEERSRLAAQGLTLACTREEWGGYPFHFKFACSTPVLRVADRLAINSSEILLTALAYAPWQIVALIDGPSTFTGLGDRAINAEHQRAIAAFTFGGDWKLNLSAKVPALSVSGHGGAEQLMLHTRPSDEGGVDVAVSAKGVSFQFPDKPTLSITEGELLGTLLPGNSLKIERVSLQLDKVRYWGSGALALDTANRPSGRLEMQTDDLDALLTLLSPYLRLTEDKKMGLRSVLSLLGNDAKAPIIARDGVLYLGPFRITGLEPLY